MRHVTIAMERVPRAVLRGGQGQLVKWVNKLSGCQRGFLYLLSHSTDSPSCIKKKQMTTI